MSSSSGESGSSNAAASMSTTTKSAPTANGNETTATASPEQVQVQVHAPKQPKSSGVAALQLELARRKRAMMRRQSSVNTMRPQKCSSVIKGFLYAWVVLLILLGLGLLCVGMYFLYYQGDAYAVPSLAYYLTALAGAGLTVISSVGMFGLQQQRRCVTKGERNYALAGFIICSIGGSIVVILGGVVGLALISVVKDTQVEQFAENQVKLLETAVVTTLGEYAKENPSGWVGIQNGLSCCGYQDTMSLALIRHVKEIDSNNIVFGRYDEDLFPTIWRLNNATGTFCTSRKQDCKDRNYATIPCPQKNADWCRVEVLQRATENYMIIGIFAIVLGGCQILSTILATYTLLCDVRMLPKKSTPIEVEPVALSTVGDATGPDQEQA